MSALQVELVGLKARFSEAEAQNASLRETILNLTHENELLKRRIYGNKTERFRTSELQLALGDLLDSEKQLQKELETAVAAAGAAGGKTEPQPDAVAKPKPTGRRDLSTSKLPRFDASWSRCGLNRSPPRPMRQRLENQDLHPNDLN